MKVVALNGSPRLVGNTSAAVSFILDEMEKHGFETEHIQMYGSIMTPCNDCGSCAIRGDGRCINEDDDMNAYLGRLTDADAVILASPSYFGGIPGQMGYSSNGSDLRWPHAQRATCFRARSAER